ncbi:MAG: DMT family transporter [Ilumatobacteraceae bacterium]
MRSHLAVRRFGPRELVLSGVLSLTWGSSFLLIALAIEYVDPAVVPFGRSLLGAITLTFFPGAREAIPWRHWPRIALLGLVWMALPFWLFPLAEQTVTSGVAGMINGGLPVVIALVTALWVWRMPSVRRIVAITLGFTGIAVIALPAIWAESSDGRSIADVRGISYLLAAVLGYAVGSNIARPLQAQFAPARLLARVQISAAFWTFPLAVRGISESSFAWSAVAAIAVLGVVGTGIAFVVFGTLLERTGITRAMIPTYFTPIVGLVLGALFNDESIALLSVAGMCIVIASAWMTSKPDERDVMLSDATEAR